MRLRALAKPLLAIPVICSLSGLSGCATHSPSLATSDSVHSAESVPPKIAGATAMPSAYEQPASIPDPTMTGYTQAQMASWSSPSGSTGYQNRRSAANCFG